MDRERLQSATVSLRHLTQAFSQSHIQALAGLFKDFLVTAHAFVTSCLDYCDARSTCVTQSSLNHLHLV